MSGAQQLRKMLEAGETIVAPGAWDPITARLAESMGFPAVYLGGQMTGEHLAVGEPLLTMTEQVETAAKVVRAVDLPVLVDGHAAFGDAVHAMRCVREFERVGVAGIHIEDQVYPKRVLYHKGLIHCIPLEEFLDKMRYALKARQTEDFIIIGRTDTFRSVGGSREEALRRGKALVKLGVDVLFITGLHSGNREDLAYFRRAIPDIPMLVVGGLAPLTAKDFRELGYQIIIYSDTPMAATVGNLKKIWEGLKTKGIPAIDLQELKSMQELTNQLVGFEEYFQIEAATTKRQG